MCLATIFTWFLITWISVKKPNCKDLDQWTFEKANLVSSLKKVGLGFGALGSETGDELLPSQSYDSPKISGSVRRGVFASEKRWWGSGSTTWWVPKRSVEGFKCGDRIRNEYFCQSLWVFHSSQEGFLVQGGRRVYGSF